MNDSSPVSTNNLNPAPEVKSPPFILLPGLGCDARLFVTQRAAFPDLIVPDWIEPEPNESLADYAARFAKVIDPGVPCFIGGVSFGGVMALEVAARLATYECHVIASVRSPQQVPRRLSVFRSTSDLIFIPKWLGSAALYSIGPWVHPVMRGVLRQLHEANLRFVRWAAKAILTWTPSAGVERVRVVQIHGDRDILFPIKNISADLTIEGGGHLMSLTHSLQINQYLRERMAAALAKGWPPE